MSQNKASLIADIWLDMKMILAYESKPLNLRNILWAWLACDAFIIIMSFRIRKWTHRHRIPFVNRILRFLQTALFAIELGIDIELGHGVYFVHSVGTVVGGDARIGNACVFFGNNTIGASRFRGSPNVGAGTVIGAGVRILGKIEVGENCFLGANAVVVDNIPSGKVAVGIPARIIADSNLGPSKTMSDLQDMVV